VIGFFDRLSRPLMRALGPEDAHALAIKEIGRASCRERVYENV
jgi:hypothetical protein